jgi:nucleotide-binding universal stress UspA family protein
MAQRLLVPLDGSELAESAIPWAQELAERLSATMELVRIVLPDLASEGLDAEIALSHHLAEPTLPDTVAPSHEAEEMHLRKAEIALEHVRDVRKWSGSVDVVVLQGEPATEIVHYAERSGATLIVMATHARSGPLRALLGSIAGEVIDGSHVPVLVIRPGLPPESHLLTRVLVPLDGSALSDAILPVVTPLARQLGWTLVLFSVADPPPPTVSIQGATIPLGHVPTVPPAQIMEHLDRVAAGLRETAVEVETRVASGDPAHAITQAIREAEADLVAMSTHGRRGLERWVRGSVTDAVLHHAEVPVLVVRPKEAPAPHAGGSGRQS